MRRSPHVALRRLPLVSITFPLAARRLKSDARRVKLGRDET